MISGINPDPVCGRPYIATADKSFFTAAAYLAVGEIPAWIACCLSGRDEFEGAFARLVTAHVGAFIVQQDDLFVGNRTLLIELATQRRLPGMFVFSLYPRSGGLMSYGANAEDLYRRAAEYVDRILKGTKPSDLPVERPTKFELVVNLKTAKALGLTIPPSLLQRADQVIE